jgi:hypothetical protein
LSRSDGLAALDYHIIIGLMLIPDKKPIGNGFPGGACREDMIQKYRVLLANGSPPDCVVCALTVAGGMGGTEATRCDPGIR